MNRMKEMYVNEIAPALNKKFGYKSVMHHDVFPFT